MSKITIISGSSSVLNSIQAKLKLLRTEDVVLKCDIAEIEKCTIVSDLILLQVNSIDNSVLDIIKTLKKSDNAIILLTENINSKNILKAYDIGVCDFALLDISDYELLVKIINAKKMLQKEKALWLSKSLLREYGVIKSASNVFVHLKDIKYFNERINSTMISITIEKSTYQDFLLNNYEANFCTLLRDSDMLINYEELKYLIILPQTPIENGIKVVEKLQTALNLNFNAVIFQYKNETVDELLKKINCLEFQREQKHLNFYTEEVDENINDDWLENAFDENDSKQYKFFQNIFNQKIKSVIEPTFYRIKQKYENKFTNTKIKYFIDKNQAELLSVDLDVTNSLKIQYKNNAKIIINKNYVGLNTPENEIIELSFSQLTSRNLTDLTEDFIKKIKGEI